MSQQPPEPPIIRRPTRSAGRPVPPAPDKRPPAGQPRPVPPTSRVDSADQQPRRPLAWSATDDPPAASEPSRSPRPTLHDDQPGARGYAPRQTPEPIPAADARRDRPRAYRNDEPARPSNRPARPAAGPRRPRSEAPIKPRHRRITKRRVLILLLVLFLLLVAVPTGLLFYYDSKLHRVDALADYSGRPADTPGTNWLLVGTDSRADLSAKERRELGTGDAAGSRTDTIMLVHLPTKGKPMLISVPRDLYVEVPGQGMHKINSAFNNGGPQLLVQTVEKLSGLHIDHYAEIGFGGFDRLVEGVGGVRICLSTPVRDSYAGINLPAGCQKLNGREALGLVRTRYAFAGADLTRVANQRKFLSALVSRAMSPSVLLNPFRFFPFMNGAVDSLTVDKGDHLWNLAWLGYKLHGDTMTVTVPAAADRPETDDGQVVPTDQSTEDFFGYLRRGENPPTQGDDGYPSVVS